jgi:hypothetical protein
MAKAKAKKAKPKAKPKSRKPKKLVASARIKAAAVKSARKAARGATLRKGRAGKPAAATQGLLEFSDRWNASVRETRAATNAVQQLADAGGTPAVREDALR